MVPPAGGRPSIFRGDPANIVASLVWFGFWGVVLSVSRYARYRATAQDDAGRSWASVCLLPAYEVSLVLKLVSSVLVVVLMPFMPSERYENTAAGYN